MKILFLTSRLPYPPFRGDKLKIWNLISELSKRHEVFLLAIIQHKSDRRWVAELRKVCQEVETVRLTSVRSVFQCLLALPRKIPFQVAYFQSNEVRIRLMEMLQRIKPDILHTHLIRMADYTADIDSVPKILDMTDAVSLYLSRFKQALKNPLLKALVGMELNRISKYEQTIARFDRGLVCSEADKLFLEKRVPSANVSLLYNGVDLTNLTPDATVTQVPFRIVFTGNMDYYPNADAASYFVKEIFPIIKLKYSTAEFYIVGQNPPRRVRALESKDVIVTGFVDDIRREYLKSAVAVSPVRFGAGTLNKVLEPLALGVPVVTTSIGIEGLHMTNSKEILIADSAVDFAAAVCAVLGDPLYGIRMADAAKEKIRNRLSWTQIAMDLERIYREVTTQRRTGKVPKEPATR